MRSEDLEKLVKNLPASPGILRKDEFFNSAVIIPFVLKDGEYYLLFEKRAANIRQGGEICFPGGEYDPKLDKNFTETAVRETIEELGIDISKINVVGILDTLIGPMGVTVDSCLATLSINNIDELNLDTIEVEKVFLVPVSYFQHNPPQIYHVQLVVHPHYTDESGNLVNLLPSKELELPEKYKQPWHAGKRQIFVYKLKEGVLWGLTAALVREVSIRLKEIG
ncbi:MAG TPA: CoA pyrophosphatase [Ignavibacteriaceae bacterium]|nr:CoA pyrophosphatase [Ignavibacteriaceae bacterium]